MPWWRCTLNAVQMLIASRGVSDAHRAWVKYHFIFQEKHYVKGTPPQNTLLAIVSRVSGNPIDLLFLFVFILSLDHRQFPRSLSVLMGWARKAPLPRSNGTLDLPLHHCIVSLKAPLIRVTVTGPHIGTLSSTGIRPEQRGLTERGEGRWQLHSQAHVTRRPRKSRRGRH